MLEKDDIDSLDLMVETGRAGTDAMIDTLTKGAGRVLKAGLFVGKFLGSLCTEACVCAIKGNDFDAQRATVGSLVFSALEYSLEGTILPPHGFRIVCDIARVLLPNAE